MSALVSTWSRNVHTVPENFVCSPEERPGDLAVPLCEGIPVVDLQQVDGHDRADSIKQIMKGSQDFGMFQVFNYGLPKELMDDTMSLFKEFFDMPEEDTATYYSEDTKVVGTYSVEVRKLGLRILDLICEGLGVEVGYFAGDLSKFQGMIVNHYPPCPNPSLVLGVRGHYDTNLLTLLQQDEYGLHILKDGQWVGVKHVPNAFVINIGSQLEIISNGKLTSIKHRAVTNSRVSRMSIVTFINPSEECIIESAKTLVSACNPLCSKLFNSKSTLKLACQGSGPQRHNTEVLIAPSLSYGDLKEKANQITEAHNTLLSDEAAQPKKCSFKRALIAMRCGKLE